MKLPLSQIRPGENRYHFSSLKDSWLKDMVSHVASRGYEVRGDLRFDMKLTKVEPDYYMNGQLAFQVAQECARCAETFSFEVQHPFELAFEHVEKLQNGGAQLSDESEEVDICFFGGNELELNPVVEEQFFLSLPYQPLCKPDCKGICQKCGQNLNLKSCSCPKQETEQSSFSVLKGWKH